MPPVETLCEGWSEELGGFCVASGSGAWEEESTSEDLQCPDGESGTVGRRRLRYTTLDGTDAELEREPYELCLHGSGLLELVPLGHYDYDGDGHAEIVLERRVALQAREVEVLQFTGESIRDYPAAADAMSASVFRVDDVDGDGRPDLVTHLPHAQLVAVDHEFSDREFQGGPNTLWHALPDGTFTHSDAVAIEFLARSCGEPGSALISDVELGSIRDCAPFLDAARRNVTCARLRGSSVEDVRASLRATVTRFPCARGPSTCCDALATTIDSLLAQASRVDTSVMIGAQTP